MDAYERYGRALLRKAERIVGNREDARDILQALFVDLYQRSDAPMDLPYLYRAVTNRCLTFLRDEGNRGRLLEHHDAALAPTRRTACDDQVIGHDLLLKLVRELDPAESEVLAYRFVDDMTQDEIATLLGLSRKTVGKRLDRIRDAVRKLTAPSGGEP
ncbi:MAG TPA: sigma-70 family RNA polymerase sigma factor [Polyangiaceae bacterium]|jgi:RNA polymerase sigma-70 factor (ECF subfamily)|nr:sigma-70 family RNA polymerase sigma factor [Polyangiaceae bacterium]